MVFCNTSYICCLLRANDSHNPYFSRWFSAMKELEKQYNNVNGVTILILVDGFLQCKNKDERRIVVFVTILILVDGFLQCMMKYVKK